MADYKDIGKVADDLFGPGPGRKTKKDRVERPENPSGETVSEPENSLFPRQPVIENEEENEERQPSGLEQVSDVLLDNIRKIRQMVESDLKELDEAAGKTPADLSFGESFPSPKPTGTENMQENTTGPNRPDTGTGASVQTEMPASAPENKPERPAMEELDELIGLDSIKADVKELIDLVKTQKLRKEQGMKSVPVSLHLVFSGNPGTGKTTVARILARLYKEIGVLSKGQLIEVDRSGLVAGFIGQTAIKTQEKIQQAMGGILFIDEAYTLAKEGQDYGQEAIDTILKAMEDNRDGFVVIVAGYTDLMKKFVESNPGLKSRFNKYFEFPDYTAQELMDIFQLQCRKYEYVLNDQAEASVRKMIDEMEQAKGANFANARDVRNLFERIITDQARRIAKMEAPSAEDLKMILPVDVDGEKSLCEDATENEAGEAKAAPGEGTKEKAVAGLEKTNEKAVPGSVETEKVQESVVEMAFKTDDTRKAEDHE